MLPSQSHRYYLQLHIYGFIVLHFLLNVLLQDFIIMVDDGHHLKGRPMDKMLKTLYRMKATSQLR